jgi:hypothetical protein
LFFQLFECGNFCNQLLFFTKRHWCWSDVGFYWSKKALASNKYHAESNFLTWFWNQSSKDWNLCWMLLELKTWSAYST